MRALLPILLLAGCSLHHEPGIYPLALDAAQSRLRQADRGPLITARACSVPLDIAVATRGGGALHWSIRGEGQELATFTVRFEAVGREQTRTIIDLATAPGPAPLTAPSGQPALRQPLQGAVVEFVDAALNARPFDPARMEDQRPLAEGCTTAPTGVPVKSKHPDPWSNEANNAEFGTPMASTRPGDDTVPAVANGQEDRKEDLPKPGG